MCIEERLRDVYFGVILGRLEFFFVEVYGDHRVLHGVARRQRLMCISYSSKNSVYPYRYTLPSSSLIFPEANWAVSETHLRVHETGSNLVCRLLPEKTQELSSYLVPIVY